MRGRRMNDVFRPIVRRDAERRRKVIRCFARLCLALKWLAVILAFAVSCANGAPAGTKYVSHAPIVDDDNGTDDDDDNDDNDNDNDNNDNDDNDDNDNDDNDNDDNDDNDNDNDDNDNDDNDNDDDDETPRDGCGISPLTVWGTSPSSVFAGGVQGVCYYDGVSWSEQPFPPGPDGGVVNGIWSWSATYVFAVGVGYSQGGQDFDNYIWQMENSSWSSTLLAKTDFMSSVWGASPSDVFAFGMHIGSGDVYSVVAMHFDGSSWSPLPINGGGGGLYKMWGISTSDIFVAGTAGDLAGPVLHYDGSSWSTVGTPAPQCYPYGVWASSDSDLYIAGQNPDLSPEGRIAHYNGSSWTTEWESEQASLSAVWGSSPFDVFVGGNGETGPNAPFVTLLLHFDGVSWSPMTAVPSNVQIQGLWGSSASDVFAVGSSSAPSAEILHYDGAAWTVMIGSPSITVSGKR